FEGDPTNINQIPQPPGNTPATPATAAGTPQPRPSLPQFSSGSPQLSHVGGPPPQINPTPYGQQVMPVTYVGTPGAPVGSAPNMNAAMSAASGAMLGQQPGPPMSSVSGVIAQPTPYVSRSRIYAFVVDETGLPIQLGPRRVRKGDFRDAR